METGEQLEQLELKWITEWATVTPNVVRVYLNHTYDDELEGLVEETSQYLGHKVLWRKDAQGRWSIEQRGEEVVWLEDPDMLERGDSEKYPFEDDGVTILLQVQQREERYRRQGFP